MNTAPEFNPVAKFNRSDKKSRVLAIKAFCATCMGCDDTAIEPGFARQVRECSATTCPLFTFRPYQHNDADEE